AIVIFQELSKLNLSGLRGGKLRTALDQALYLFQDREWFLAAVDAAVGVGLLDVQTNIDDFERRLPYLEKRTDDDSVAFSLRIRGVLPLLKEWKANRGAPPDGPKHYPGTPEIVLFSVLFRISLSALNGWNGFGVLPEQGSFLKAGMA